MKEMIEMLMEQATTVRKEWSSVCDSVMHDKPKFIKRTRDKMWFSNLETMAEILKAYKFTAEKYLEDDGSVTLSLNEIDLIENGKDEQEARELLGKAILEYSVEYYNEYALYSHTPNRKAHVPYIFKALIMDEPKEIGASIECRGGKN
ncbi:hypothetical protein [Sporofaciens sp. SGI.106]|uniref:hypothetical protein n=1 Tax=Sporofaciens sp. SGI.106 TaxID=3420568 RepID=UPI003D01DCC1